MQNQQDQFKIDELGKGQTEEGLVPARARYSGRIILKFWARVEMSASVYFHVYTHGARRRFMQRLQMKVCAPPGLEASPSDSSTQFRALSSTARGPSPAQRWRLAVETAATNPRYIKPPR